MHKKTREYAKIFSFLWGRGFLYLLISSILSLRLLNPIDGVYAAFFALLGLVDIVVRKRRRRRRRRRRRSKKKKEDWVPTPPHSHHYTHPPTFTGRGENETPIGRAYWHTDGGRASDPRQIRTVSTLAFIFSIDLPTHPPTHRADFERQGRIPATDLATICADLGSRLSHQELEGAILTLDANRNGEVRYEDFLEWWRTR